MASDDLGDDEVLMLLGATACVLLACMCRPKSDVNDRGSKTRRVWVGDLFRRRCIAGLNRNYKTKNKFLHPSKRPEPLATVSCAPFAILTCSRYLMILIEDTFHFINIRKCTVCTWARMHDAIVA
jgi:hypothetical protein